MSRLKSMSQITLESLSSDRARRARRGASFMVVLTVLAVVGIGTAVVGWMMFGGKKKAGPGPLVNLVSKGQYDFVVLEQGEVESSSNTELRCEVKSRGGGGGSSGGGGITILEVVPEGTIVSAGEVVVKLDSSSLEQERIQQQITVNTSLSLVVQARNIWEAAQIARKEYLEGTFKQEEKVIMGEVFVAEQGLRTAQLAYESSQRLAAKGLLAPLQLEGAQFAVDNARNQLEAAQSKLEVLRKYTREKMLKQFDSDIATAEAKVKAEESSHKLELQKLQEVEEQIAKCIIRAPAPGEVVYANRYNSGRSGSSAEFVVEPGATVREQQPIVRLPDGNKMQVKALVNEARVTLVRPGLPVSIRIDALKDEIIQGEVVKVNQYADPGGWSSGNIKKYATIVKILNPPSLLRSGMNAEVRIHIERRPDALQVPVQALAEHKGHFFVLVKNGDQYETREVTIGSTNDKVAVIDKGLAENDQVVMNPRGQIGRLVLPDLPEATTNVQLAEIRRPTGAPIITAAGLPKGPGGGSGGGEKKKGRSMTAAGIVSSAMESDTDKDGKLSKEEISQIQGSRQSMVATADANSDGFVDRDELTKAAGPAAAAANKRMQERKAAGGGDNGPGGGAGGPATGGGQ